MCAVSVLLMPITTDISTMLRQCGFEVDASSTIQISVFAIVGDHLYYSLLPLGSARVFWPGAVVPWQFAAEIEQAIGSRFASLSEILRVRVDVPPNRLPPNIADLRWAVCERVARNRFEDPGHVDVLSMVAPHSLVGTSHEAPEASTASH